MLKHISNESVEFIMLVVTQVNGCECSYSHTKMALRQGFSQAEINTFLEGNDAYKTPTEAKEIVSAIQMMMMMGNVLGLPLSALKS